MNPPRFLSSKEKEAKEFEEYFPKLAFFVQKNGAMPSKKEDHLLHQWMGRVRILKKKNLLDPQHEKLLSNIGFVWDIRQSQWKHNFDKVNELLEKDIIPNGATHPYLYYWILTQHHVLKQPGLQPEKEKLILALFDRVKELKEKAIADTGMITGKKQARWNTRYLQLVEFKKQNPERWPDRKSADPAESNLANWCLYIRNHYSKGLLPALMREKLAAISFNFPQRRNKVAHTY